MIASGLRVFDIRDPRNPREMAYYVAPNRTSRTASAPSNYAMSSPSFVPERSEIWYSDGNSGFYNVKLAGWPFRRAAPAPRRATARVTPASAPCPPRRRDAPRD